MSIQTAMTVQLLGLIIRQAGEHIEHGHPEVAAEVLKQTAQIIDHAVDARASLLGLAQVVRKPDE